MVDQDDPDLAAIVAVDGAGRIQAGDAVLQRQTRAGPHLGLIARLQRDLQPGRDQLALSGGQHDRLELGHGGAQVHARRSRRLIGGQGQALGVGQAFDADGGHG
ncbi:hypothetical protein D3C72_2028550 [compost metagenome]